MYHLSMNFDTAMWREILFKQVYVQKNPQFVQINVECFTIKNQKYAYVILSSLSRRIKSYFQLSYQVPFASNVTKIERIMWWKKVNQQKISLIVLPRCYGSNIYLMIALGYHINLYIYIEKFIQTRIIQVHH